MPDDAMTREDLEEAAQGCTVPGCQHDTTHGVFLHARCHPLAGMRAQYLDGVLTLRCRTCKAWVCAIAVEDTHHA